MVGSGWSGCDKAGVALAAGLFATGWLLPSVAAACGCFSRPIPASVDDDYAVSQQSEQLLFEVEPDGHVTAHVMIQYAGSPESFAWIVPVPNPPVLSLSNEALFGLLDGSTSPVVSVARQDLCPDPDYVCERHPWPQCDLGSSSNADAGGSGGDSSAGEFAGSAPGGAPPIKIIDRQVIGAYDTITFAAGDSLAAVTWLQDQGFIVNDTMAPYMQPYADDNMVFVAAKLLPGAGVDEIRPLKMRYEGDKPCVPLRLTAVGTEPHLTVTSHIYASGPFKPQGRPLAGIDPSWITTGPDGRNNYPSVLARAVDDVGGDGFVIEYAGAPVAPPVGDDFCCGQGEDVCRVRDDGQCQCPTDTFDAGDCEESGLGDAAVLLEDLRTRYDYLTRITTRMSAEEMTFDPMFEATDDTMPVEGRLTLRGSVTTLERCESDVVDGDRYASIRQLLGCANLYCGHGECVATSGGPAGCECDAGYVARTFTDLDGADSVTCIPREHPVSYAMEGVVLPDACDGVDCSSFGTCLDVGGSPTCVCASGNAAMVRNDSPAPYCAPIVRRSGGPGARDASSALDELRVCAPEPPTDCGEFGWLVKNEVVRNQGILCPSSVVQNQQLFEVPAEPTCDDYAVANGFDDFDDWMESRGGGAEPDGGSGGTPLDGHGSVHGDAGADPSGGDGGPCSASPWRPSPPGLSVLLLALAGLWLGARRRV